jgi:hypothetical protein
LKIRKFHGSKNVRENCPDIFTFAKINLSVFAKTIKFFAKFNNFQAAVRILHGFRENKCIRENVRTNKYFSEKLPKPMTSKYVHKNCAFFTGYRQILLFL